SHDIDNLAILKSKRPRLETSDTPIEGQGAHPDVVVIDLEKEPVKEGGDRRGRPKKAGSGGKEYRCNLCNWQALASLSALKYHWTKHHCTFENPEDERMEWKKFRSQY